MGIGVAFIVIWALLILVPVGGFLLALWALIDAFNKPEWAWKAAGENRDMYFALLGISLAMCQPLGWIPALMYFLGAKPRVVAAAAMLPPPTPAFPGYPPQNYYGAPPGGPWAAGGQPPPPGQPQQGAWPANPVPSQQGNWPANPGQPQQGAWPANPGGVQPPGPSYEPPRYDLPETPSQKGPFD